jgi:hypothetical protein
MNVNQDLPIGAKLEQDKLKWDAAQQAKKTSQQKVVITEIDIPFTNLVSFLVKLAVAAVPAGIIVAIIWLIVSAVIFGSLSR